MDEGARTLKRRRGRRWREEGVGKEESVRLRGRVINQESPSVGGTFLPDGSAEREAEERVS